MRQKMREKTSIMTDLFWLVLSYCYLLPAALMI
jgi:hypothetical protein